MAFPKTVFFQICAFPNRFSSNCFFQTDVFQHRFIQKRWSPLAKKKGGEYCEKLQEDWGKKGHLRWLRNLQRWFCMVFVCFGIVLVLYGMRLSWSVLVCNGLYWSVLGCPGLSQSVLVWSVLVFQLAYLSVLVCTGLSWSITACPIMVFSGLSVG